MLNAIRNVLAQRYQNSKLKLPEQQMKEKQSYCWGTVADKQAMLAGLYQDSHEQELPYFIPESLQLCKLYIFAALAASVNCIGNCVARDILIWLVSRD